MKPFFFSKKLDFLNDLHKYLQDNFADNYANVKIIMPSGYLCQKMSERILCDGKAKILPKILTIGDLCSESEEIFNMPSNSLDTLTPIEEKILLTNIINEYKPLSYNQLTALRLAPSLAKLFFEIEANNHHIDHFEFINDFKHAEHWQNIFHFLRYAYNRWQQEILNLGKSTKASNLKYILESEISRLNRQTDHHIILANIVFDNATARNFAKNIKELKNGHIILPALPSYDEKLARINAATHPLYYFHKQMKLLQLDIEQISRNHIPCIYDPLIFANKITSPNNHFQTQFFEFDSGFEEAMFVAKKCQEINTNDPQQTIAIICQNMAVKKLFVNQLNTSGLNFKDLIGDDITDNNAVDFILCVSRYLTEEFSVSNLISILSHPEFVSPLSTKLRSIILEKHRFASNFQSILDNLPPCEEMHYFANNLAKILSTHLESGMLFNYITKQIIGIVEKLLPKIWQKHTQFNISPAINEICFVSQNLIIENINLYTDSLAEILSGGKIFTGDSQSQILLCRLADAYLANFDHVFIVDANENKLPSQPTINPWLSERMQKDFDLDINNKHIGQQIFQFYSYMQNSNVYISRSYENIYGNNLLASPLILQLKQILTNFSPKKLQLKKNSYTSPDQHSDSAILTTHFPDRISATDIEILMKAPYNFYAKKILNLTKQKQFEESPNLAEFGNFIHLIFEQFCNNFKSDNDKKRLFTTVSEKILSTLEIPLPTIQEWRYKAEAIAEEFIEFSQEREAICKKIIVEQKGTMALNIGHKSITISAIADRIEYRKSGKIVIIDYKTGIVPAISEVKNGRSPQLLVESMILADGGFGDFNFTNIELQYIKIASNKPYIRITNIELSKEDLLIHKDGMINLLTKCANLGVYDPAVSANLNYDDYAHLARRII